MMNSCCYFHYHRNCCMPDWHLEVEKKKHLEEEGQFLGLGHWLMRVGEMGAQVGGYHLGARD